MNCIFVRLVVFAVVSKLESRIVYKHLVSYKNPSEHL